MCKPLLHRVSSLLLQLWLITYQWGYKVNQCWSLTPEYWGVRFPNQQPPTLRLYLGPVAQQGFIHQLEEVRKHYKNTFFESSVSCPWVIPESTLSHPCFILEASLSHPCFILEASLGHPLGIPGASLGHPWGIPKASPRHPSGIPQASPRHHWGIPESSQSHQEST